MIGRQWTKRVVGSIALVLLALCAASGQRRNRPPQNSGESDYVKSKWMDMYLWGPSCKLVGAAGPGQRRDCDGLGGYRLLYSGPAERPDIVIVTPTGRRFPLEYWRPNDERFISLSSRVQWSFLNSGNKIELLALVLTAKVKPLEFSRFGHGDTTIMVKLTPREVCTVGRIWDGPDSSADFAGFIIETRYHKCIGPDNFGVEDWIGVVFGLVEEKRFEEAKTTIRNIREPATRVTAYAAIAEGQAKTGDIAAARSTLFLGLQDVQKKQDWVDEYGRRSFGDGGYSFSLKVRDLIVAMTRVGLYDDAKATMNFLAPEDVFPTLLTNARIQGRAAPEGRGDSEASRASFNEAIEMALTPSDSDRRDGRLVQIVDAQVDIGFTEDAKRTANLIKTASQRDIVERIIRERGGKPN